MRAALGPAVLALTLLAPPAAAATRSEIDSVREAIYPALVNITVVNERFANGRTHRFPGAGSGVIVTLEGHVLTNYHVAGETARISCTLTDGRIRDAAIVANDPLTDLSILAIEAREGDEPFPAAELGNSDGLAVGETVFAMGNPLALSSSMTQGIVSNPARVFTDFTGTEMQELFLGEGELTGLLTRWIQHDALILPGNSGGPLVDLEGRVIGINELGGRGIGFAIPSNIARRVLERALQEGEIERGWLGFSVFPVSKLDRTTGALVSSVPEGSTAAKAGLETGDVLLALNGLPVSVRFFEEVPLLYQRIADLPVGSTASLLVERGGREIRLETMVEEMEPFTGDQEEIRPLGVTVQEITEPMAVARRLHSTEGLLVTGVRPGSSLDRAEPRPTADDVLVSIQGNEVSDLAALRSAVAELDPEREILLELRRGRESLLSVAPPARPDRRRWGGELPRAWLGVRTQVVTPELGESLALDTRSGFRVTQVFPWTEARSAGLEVGDVLVSLDGDPLTASRIQEREDLRRHLEEHSIGDVVTFSLLRDGDTLEVDVELEPRPMEAEEVESASQPELDFSVRDITFYDRIENRWDREVSGVVVTEADRGGWAQMAGLRLGDLVTEVNDAQVQNVDSFETVFEGVIASRPDLVRLFVHRGARTHFVLIEPDWEEISLLGGEGSP